MDAGSNVDTFMRFAQHFADVRYREAHAMFAKMDFWSVRAEIYGYGDEP